MTCFRFFFFSPYFCGHWPSVASSSGRSSHAHTHTHTNPFWRQSFFHALSDTKSDSRGMIWHKEARGLVCKALLWCSELWPTNRLKARFAPNMRNCVSLHLAVPSWAHWRWCSNNKTLTLRLWAILLRAAKTLSLCFITWYKSVFLTSLDPVLKETTKIS